MNIRDCDNKYEKYLKLLYKNSPNLILTINRDGFTELISDSFKTLIGEENHRRIRNLHFSELYNLFTKSSDPKAGKAVFEKIKNRTKDDSCLYILPGMAQLRKTRCIIGRDTFISEDGKHCETSIGATGDFRKPGPRFELPFGILFNDNFPNLLSAGRIVSADGDGWEITRVIPTAAQTGEACGVAASLMVKQKKGAPQLEIKEVQSILVKNNVKLHF